MRHYEMLYDEQITIEFILHELSRTDLLLLYNDIITYRDSETMNQKMKQLVLYYDIRYSEKSSYKAYSYLKELAHRFQELSMPNEILDTLVEEVKSEFLNMLDEDVLQIISNPKTYTYINILILHEMVRPEGTFRDLFSWCKAAMSPIQFGSFILLVLLKQYAVKFGHSAHDIVGLDQWQDFLTHLRKTLMNHPNKPVIMAELNKAYKKIEHSPSVQLVNLSAIPFLEMKNQSIHFKGFSLIPEYVRKSRVWAWLSNVVIVTTLALFAIYYGANQIELNQLVKDRPWTVLVVLVAIILLVVMVVNNIRYLRHTKK